jgi:hypothetical protein
MFNLMSVFGGGPNMEPESESITPKPENNYEGKIGEALKYIDREIHDMGEYVNDLLYYKTERRHGSEEIQEFSRFDNMYGSWTNEEIDLLVSLLRTKK